MKKKNLKGLIIIILSMFSIVACGGPLSTTYSITGAVQKGPFINGTSITVYELDDNMTQTGLSYSSQIEDNTGKFELSGISLSSQYVEIKADGFYYNEVSGENAGTQITLYSISDITSNSTINVNLISTLEKSRVEYLIDNGLSFEEAKEQSLNEIVDIFSISNSISSNSETLDISADTDDNAKLLAISIILQGYRSSVDLSELIANFSTDFKEDGTLDSTVIGSLLINDAELLDLTTVRENLESRYSELGLQAEIPNFEKYIQEFTGNTSYEFTNYPEYPQTSIPYSETRTNILYEDLTTATTSSSKYSLAADLPQGTSLKIVISCTDTSAYWGLSDITNWSYSDWKWDGVQTLTVTESGKTADMRFNFGKSGEYTIEYYENGSTSPTKTKTITVN